LDLPIRNYIVHIHHFNGAVLAAITAHEDMNIYAYVSILDAILRLAVVILLRFILFDKLKLYGIMLCAVTIIITTVYRIICLIKYQECRFRVYWNKKLFDEIKSYAAWNLFGAISTVLQNQGIVVLLNQYFSPVLVVSKGIALSVNNAVSSFTGNFYNAIRPQIIKKYAANKKDSMMALVFCSAKLTYFLMFIFTLPLVFEMRYILTLWLKNVPEYTVVFTSLALIEARFFYIIFPPGGLVYSCGKIKLYQSIVYGISMLNLPIAFFAFKSGAPAYIVSFISVFLAVWHSVAQILIIKHLVHFPVRQFIKKVIFPLCAVTILSSTFTLLAQRFITFDFIRLIIVVMASIISISGFTYFIGLNKKEKSMVISLLCTKTGKKL
jgi:O-antigen/teichoic acid export membrane protein